MSCRHLDNSVDFSCADFHKAFDFTTSVTHRLLTTLTADSSVHSLGYKDNGQLCSLQYVCTALFHIPECTTWNRMVWAYMFWHLHISPSTSLPSKFQEFPGSVGTIDRQTDGWRLQVTHPLRHSQPNKTHNKHTAFPRQSIWPTCHEWITDRVRHLVIRRVKHQRVVVLCDDRFNQRRVMSFAATVVFILLRCRVNTIHGSFTTLTCSPVATTNTHTHICLLTSKINKLF